MVLNNTLKIILIINTLTLFLTTNSLPQEYRVINYKVKKGDTFFSLSRKFNTEIWLIQKENSISTLREGDTIKIPIRDNITYTVQKNDTLFSLSKKFNTTIEEIISVNNLQSIDIKVGQKIIIPSKLSTQKNVEKKYTRQQNDNVYVVSKGDTLFSISRKTGVSVDKIKKLNNLDDKSIIKPGMIIVLGKEYKTYTPTYNETENINYSFPVNYSTQIRKYSNKFIEIILNREEDVKAVMDGKVIFIGSFSIFGRTIIIKHSEKIYTIYGMIDNETVKIGDSVKKGMTIGKPTKDILTGNYITKFSFIVNNKMTIPNNI